ncbi:Lipopolysaccharide export system protein LptA [bacterium HR15]|nr:Lipopolysaccharide export system protein LptA [bacterium HR15]
MQRWAIGMTLLLWLPLLTPQTQPPQERARQIQFGKVRITGYERYTAESQPKTRTYQLKLFRSRQLPVRIEAPDQHLVIEANILQAQLGYNERNEALLQQAVADQGVTVRYARPKPFGTLNARARKATYDAEQSTLTLEGNVFLEAEDDSYHTLARNHERVIVYLGEETQRVEAFSSERNGMPIGELVITPKQKP